MPDRLRRAVADRRLPESALNGDPPSQWLTVVTNILAPVGVLVAYLYWFAYVRASAYYGFFGVSGAIGLQFQSRENAADSIMSLVTPVAIFAGLALMAAAFHRSITARLEQHGHSLFLPLRGAASIAAIVAGASFLPFLFEWLPTVFLTDWSGGAGWPEYLSAAAGVLLFNYAAQLQDRNRIPVTQGRRRAYGLRVWASAALVVAFVTAATGSYASDLGFEQALRVTLSGELRSVTVYSKEDQSFTGHGITSTTLPASDGFKYRYTGLRLLAVRGDQFIVVPEAERFGPPTAVLITAGDGIRIEISLP
ncbi:hypothetical protein AB0B86_27920 [Micromonospora sp. NPDC049047]|uniref:hypothetical protein n=1 Tax=Micromonospora sp. NPDC049047 TaxID=3155645 RepID=UPI003411544A